jgi:circadian clock protein KaiC
MDSESFERHAASTHATSKNPMTDVTPGPSHRLPTGIAGLDIVMEGGWPRGGSYLIQGSAGTGKTTVALHFLMQGAAAGDRCLFLSLSESEPELRYSAGTHGWTLEGIEIADLSDTQTSSTGASDYSVFSADEVELNEIMDRIRGKVEEGRPQRLVLDPISGIRMLSGNATRYRQQVLGLKDFLRNHDVTALILSDASDSETHAYLETAVRGVLSLRQELGDYGDTRRFLGVQKLRGSSFVSGEHPFRIETGGIVIFPRLGNAPPRDGEQREVCGSGVERLDRLLGGGIERGSATVISGQSGVGKTTVALQFLVQAARQGETARVFSLDESAASMLHRGEAMGLPVRQMVNEGRLKIERVRSTELYPAEFARLVQRAVDEEGVQMVLIDSLTGYRAGVSGEAHLVHHLSQLLDYLSNEAVTTFLTLESTDLTSLAVTDPFGVSYLSDNAILLRFFEAAGEVRRAINVLKKRSGPHESTIREFQFSGDGIRIGVPLVEFRGVLGGTPEYVGEDRALLPPVGENDTTRV